MIEEGIINEIYDSIYWDAEYNIKYMKDYRPDKESSNLMYLYLNVNNFKYSEWCWID